MTLKTFVDAHIIERAVITPIGVEVDVETATLALDDARAPYGRARLRCVLPDDVDRQLIDLREESLRLEVTVRQDFGDILTLAEISADAATLAAVTTIKAGGPLSALTNRYYEPWNGALILPSVRRLFNLYVDDRVFDDDKAELNLSAGTDELQLINDGLAGPAWDPGTTDLASIVALVLTRYGATLTTSTTATVAEATATIWQTGDTAWSYLDTMLEAASLRLWSDELGQFHITDRELTAAGSVVIRPSTDTTPGNMVAHRDRMTYDPDVWFDHIVVEYRWVDDLGANQVRYDYAGAQPGKQIKTFVRQGTRYPGPGAAAGILSRAAGRGRVLDVAALSDYLVTPGMVATITPPETVAQTGFVAGVSWKFPDGEMDVRTRGLTDTPPTAWLFGDIGDDWVDVPVGLKWTAFDWSLV